MRNPLGVISNAAYYLKMILPDADETVHEYLGIVSAEVRNAERIISELLDCARVRRAEREEIAAPDLVDRALARQTLPEGVELIDEIAPDLPPLWIDPRQICQVLENLISNACQAMAEGGRLRIRARKYGDLVCISVSDTGCGMSRENREMIFEPLFTTRARGIGLGLTISRNLVQQNGGSIEVESAVGKGSTFTVVLPTKEKAS